MSIKFNSIFVKADKALQKCLNNNPDVEYVHGLLTAVLCNPEIISPTVYLGFIFDKNQKDGKGLKNFDEAQELIGVITDLYNYVNDQLRDETFEPHISPEAEHVDLAMTENWCKGFFEGTALWNDSARAYPAVNAHLMTIYYFANQNKLGLKESDKKQVEKLDKYVSDKRENIKNNVLGIYTELRTDPGAYAKNDIQYYRSEPKINRNDPCPCGSGKKYKKCCGK